MERSHKPIPDLSPRKKVAKLVEDPTTPQKPTGSNLVVPSVSPLVRGRLLSPVLDEFSLRRTTSRGGTASPAPAKGVRKRLYNYRNFDHAVQLLRSSENIVVLTGAGISTSVGIPDFRSDKGLYSQLSKDLGITEAEEFFSLDYFVQNTQEFFEYVRRVIPEVVLGPDRQFRDAYPRIGNKDGRAPVPKFSLTHAFIGLLQHRNQLLTNYTQNIDGLEVAAGLSKDKFIQCHGSWDTASCLTCGRSKSAKKYLPVVFSGKVPYCKCHFDAVEESKQRKKKRSGKKRSWDDFDSDHSSDNGTRAPRGLLKPDITFFNERLSGSFRERLMEDKQKIDLLIVIGTSLKVGPVQDMLYQISPKVPQIFISKERFSGALCNLPGVQVDIELLGECDLIIEELCRRAGWLEDLTSLLWEEKLFAIKGPCSVKSSYGSSKEISQQNPTNFLKPDQRSETKTDSAKKDNDSAIQISVNDENVQVTSTHLSSSQRSIEIPNPKDKEFMVRPQAFELKKLGTDKSGTNVTSTSRPTLDRQMSTKETKPPSRIKIELVEGTSHQWRISRR